MSDDVRYEGDPIVIEIDVNDLKRIPPEPAADYLTVLANMRHVLRGAQVAVQNQMVPRDRYEAVFKGCVEGLIQSLDKILPMTENQVEVVLYALQIQGAIRKGG